LKSLDNITSLLCNGAGAAILATSALIFTPRVSAHGFEGSRFFPPTIQTDDPFATDELSLGVQVFNNPAGEGSPKTREIDFGGALDKEIFPKFALGISGAYTLLEPQGQAGIHGFDNITLSAKRQLLEIPAHEFIFSIGAEWEVGDTGSQSVGANTFSTFTPTIYAGKGMGDLPDSAPFLKPFAITGTLGVDLPLKADPNNLDWGLAVEYSLPYLEQNVKETGLPRPFRDMIPLVEFAVTQPLNRGGGGATGTINPGVLWETKDFQAGLEAVIPINPRTGPNVGVVFNVQIFIDDLFPRIFGHPIFGGDKAQP